MSKLLYNKTDVAGFILMDMKSWRNSTSDKTFQISSGISNESLKLARLAYDVSGMVTNEISPVFRWRYDSKSFIWQTDGLMIGDMG